MLGQDENLASDASAQTRRTGGILTPLSDNSLNSHDGELHGGRKRKRDGNTMEDLLKDPFVVRPYPSSVHVKPRTLHPLVLLPRSHLPLSSLDIVSSTNPLPQSRLFETHVKILELEERMGTQPMVLIARLDDGRTLYAVEREDRGLYVLCQLGSWINLQQLKSAAVVSKVESLLKPTEQESASTTRTNPEASKYTKKKRLAIEAIQSMLKRPSTGNLSESGSTPVESQPVPSSQLLETPLDDPVNEASAHLTATEIFENVRNQYFEALYSKASLAYFAKGPLSRARAAFHLDYDATLDMNEHITFLESLIMTTKLIDKKYSDGLPSCVSLLDVQDHSVDDAKHSDKVKKRKSSKKMKPGKNGLYPTENCFIGKYWDTLEDETESGGPGSSREERNKARIAQLRVRETQLQMIIILEVLALRPLASTREDIGSDLPAALPAANSDEKEKLSKAKRQDPLTTLIDVHIDRLCIWQDIAAEATHIPIGDVQSGDSSTIVSSRATKSTDNILRDFCVDVIGPFFSARLPERCAVINSKLGGPVVISPPKPRLSKSASFSGAASRPGAATKRPVPAKPRQNLQRVLSDEKERNRRSVSHGRGRSISLMRSATAPSVTGLKREASEAPSLSNIPAADSQSLKANRLGVLNSKRFSQREVDLKSLVPETSSKMKRKQDVEAELREAISALKKPNRELAGRDIVETAEKRTASAPHSRKSKKPVRNPFFQGVQITATPRMNRQKDIFSQAQNPTLAEMVDEVERAATLSSSLPLIPQSSARSPLGGPRNPLLSAVHATPSRKATSQSQSLIGSLSVPPADYAGYMPSSPLQPRRSTQLFTAVPDSTIKHTSHASTSRGGIQETPIKKRAETVHGHPVVPSPGSEKENGQAEYIKPPEMSTSVETRGTVTSSQEDIYKSLGWDDADDLDELS